MERSHGVAPCSHLSEQARPLDGPHWIFEEPQRFKAVERVETKKEQKATEVDAIKSAGLVR